MNENTTNKIAGHILSIYNIVKNFDAEEQYVTAKALPTKVLENEIFEREVKAKRVLDDLYDVLNTETNTLDEAQALLREVRRIVRG